MCSAFTACAPLQLPCSLAHAWGSSNLSVLAVLHQHAHVWAWHHAIDGHSAGLFEHWAPLCIIRVIAGATASPGGEHQANLMPECITGRLRASLGHENSEMIARCWYLHILRMALSKEKRGWCCRRGWSAHGKTALMWPGQYSWDGMFKAAAGQHPFKSSFVSFEVTHWSLTCDLTSFLTCHMTSWSSSCSAVTLAGPAADQF